MNISIHAPAYVLGESSNAELRLELLNEMTAASFVEAMKVLPNRKMRILNVGCGSGHLEARLSALFSDSLFVGIDNSPQRIAEAMARVKTLKDTNVYEFIEADLTTLPLEEEKSFDILIFRFVLCHLSNGLKQFERYLSLVRPGGSVCFEECASDGSEYFCNTKNSGYETFIKMIPFQIEAEQSSFEIGFALLSELKRRSYSIHYCKIEQPLMQSNRSKSIIRLGFEDAKAFVLQHMKEEEREGIIHSLREFEEDKLAYGLYTRSLAVIAKTPGTL